MICNKCNHKLPDDSEFCQYCGSKIDKAEVVGGAALDNNATGLIDELSNPDITTDDTLSAILGFQAKATIDAMEANADVQPDNEGDDDFGLVLEKPIFTLALKSVDGEKEYLNRLCTESGEKIKYTRRGYTSIKGINGMIDIYDTFLPSGQPYKTIYINMYGAKASVSAPKGFIFAVEKPTIKPMTEIPAVPTNRRYCTDCGSLIDNESKVCTGCGKQYFRGIKYLLGKIFNEQNLALIIVSSLLLVSFIVNIILAANVADYSNAYQSSKDEIANLQNKVDWINSNIVFVVDDNTNLYHKYDCYKFKGNPYWAYNIEWAIYLGYEPCSLCCD